MDIISPVRFLVFLQDIRFEGYLCCSAGCLTLISPLDYVTHTLRLSNSNNPNESEVITGNSADIIIVSDHKTRMAMFTLKIAPTAPAPVKPDNPLKPDNYSNVWLLYSF